MYKAAIDKLEREAEVKASEEVMVPQVGEGELYLQSAKFLLKLLGNRSKSEIEAFKQRDSIFERFAKIEEMV